jgi:hypothetical protein
MFPFSLTFLWVSLAWTWARFVGRRTFLGIRRNFMCENSEQVREYLMEWLSVSVPFLNIVYNGLCMKTLNTFSCIELRDGTSVLAVATDVVCWDSAQHRTMVVISIAAFCLYIVGIPGYVFCTMMYAHRNDKFKHPEFLQVLGFLYTRYGAVQHPADRHTERQTLWPAEPDFFLWELAFLLRRLAFCVCVVVFRFHPFAQGVRTFALRPCSGPATHKLAWFRFAGRRSICNRMWNAVAI